MSVTVHVDQLRARFTITTKGQGARFHKTYKLAVTAHATKMYRQVCISAKHNKLRRNVWRSEPSMSIQDYRMLRVTYAVAAASHLAVKAMALLYSYAMLNESISYFSKTISLYLAKDRGAHALGLIWNTKIDHFIIAIDIQQSLIVFSFRPVVIVDSKYNDVQDVVPKCLELVDLKIDRWLGCGTSFASMADFHVFSAASERGCTAVIYARMANVELAICKAKFHNYVSMTAGEFDSLGYLCGKPFFRNAIYKRHQSTAKLSEPLLSQEIAEAELRIVKQEISHCRSKTPLPFRSSLLRLQPFLEKDGILRVEGLCIAEIYRIRHSQVYLAHYSQAYLAHWTQLNVSGFAAALLSHWCSQPDSQIIPQVRETYLP
ncbi:unnamed protein product [Ceratitis capitata]|uniref:(Mediterranean fruit fly) hypothetical protein n=1 Tax=Ceratitis capitata TaxID=7213 RepID=A0A811US74_CERCA|nr:unnamed protein product [Ceratitis capitata]